MDESRVHRHGVFMSSEPLTRKNVERLPSSNDTCWKGGHGSSTSAKQSLISLEALRSLQLTRSRS
jgi:hypothetical protein